MASRFDQIPKGNWPSIAVPMRAGASSEQEMDEAKFLFLKATTTKSEALFAVVSVSCVHATENLRIQTQGQQNWILLPWVNER